MLHIEDLYRGQLIIMHDNYDRNNVSGTVYKIIAFNHDRESIELESVFSMRIGQLISYSFGYVSNAFSECPYREEDLRHHYTFKVTDSGTAYIDTFGKKPTVKKVINYTLEDLKKLFKYIPVLYKGNVGFYYNGNIIYKKITTKRVGGGLNRKGINYKPIKTLTFETIEFIPIEEKEIVNYYDAEAIKSFCMIKVKGFTKSAKLFQYVNEKKELLGKTLETKSTENKDLIFNVLEVKLNDTVKKSTELQNTISIDGKTRKLRFVMDELEIIYPNVNGWSKPKDRTIKKGSTVILKDNRRLAHIKRNDVLVATDIKAVGNKKYLGIKVNNKLVYENIRSFKAI